MTSLIVRDLDDAVMSELRVRAARNGRSVEDEARAILGEEVRRPLPRDVDRLLEKMRAPFAEAGYPDLEIPLRDSIAEPPDFS